MRIDVVIRSVAILPLAHEIRQLAHFGSGAASL
jgi:hypothetical protein